MCGTEDTQHTPQSSTPTQPHHLPLVSVAGTACIWDCGHANRTSGPRNRASFQVVVSHHSNNLETEILSGLAQGHQKQDQHCLLPPAPAVQKAVLASSARRSTIHGISDCCILKISPLSVNRLTAPATIMRTETSQERDRRKMGRIQGSPILGTIFSFLNSRII